MLWRTLPIALDGTLPACLTVCSQVSSQDTLKYTPSTLPFTPLRMFSYTLPGMYDGLGSQVRCVQSSRLGVCHRMQWGVYFRACLEVFLRVSWERTWEHTVKRAGSVPPSAIGSIHSQVHHRVAVKYTPNRTRWYTLSLLRPARPSTLSRGETLQIVLDDRLPCTFHHAWSWGLLSYRCQALGGVTGRRQAPWLIRQVAYGGYCLVGGVWCVVCCRRQVAYGGQIMT